MIIETYKNSLYEGHECRRYSVHPKVYVGGSILGLIDAVHLRCELLVVAVINVETEHSDEGKGIHNLLECRVPDDGTPFPSHLVQQAVTFAARHSDSGPVYVHCQMGGSRSPAFAYAILRAVHGMGPASALAAIREGCVKTANYGEHPYHKAYLAAVERALA